MKATVSGIRGVAGGDLDLRRVIEAAGSLGAEFGDVVVGADTRPTGPAIKRAVAAALAGAGAEARDVGTAPTPVIFRESRGRAGVAVTSSHNPLEWNGIKIAIDGRAAGAGAYSAGGARGDGRAGSVRPEPGACERYVRDAIQEAGSAGQARVCVDAGGGAAALTAPAVLEGMGCRVGIVRSSRGPDPASDPLDELASASGDAPGFAYDLDGDRLVAVLRGRRQPPDATLALGVARCVGEGAKKFVLSADTSMGVEEIVRGGGGSVRRSAVGEANVVGMMAEHGAEAGGEGSSGGFILPSFNGCRDGVLCSALISAMTDAQIGEVLGVMSGYHLVRRAYGARGADAGKLESWLRSESYDVSCGDGLAGRSEDSWVLVRESNTEDVVRVSAEARGRSEAERLAAGAAEAACGVGR